MAGKTCFPGDESCEALIDDSSFDSSLSLGACGLYLDFRFLVSKFDVLIAEKKRQTSLTLDSCKSHSSLFFANPVPGSLNLLVSNAPYAFEAGNGTLRFHFGDNITFCLVTYYLLFN